MRIIDAHAHIFEHLHGIGWRGEFRCTGNGEGVWANGDRMRIIPEGMGDSSFTAEALIALMDNNGVEKAVLLQGSLYGFANDYVSECVKRYGGRFVGAGSYDPYCLDADNILSRLTGELGYRVIKLEFSSFGGFMGFHNDFRIDGSLLDPLWARAVAEGLVVVLDMGSPGDKSFQVGGIARVMERYPGLSVVVTHLGAPRLDHREQYTHMLKALKPYEALCFDLSALLWNTSPEAPPYPTAAEYLSLARDNVGPGRLLWGSDVPCVMTRFSYRELVSNVLDSGVFTVDELDMVFYRNALSVYF